MDWEELRQLVKEEKKKGNPIAMIIQHLKLDSNEARPTHRHDTHTHTRCTTHRRIQTQTQHSRHSTQHASQSSSRPVTYPSRQITLLLSEVRETDTDEELTDKAYQVRAVCLSVKLALCVRARVGVCACVCVWVLSPRRSTLTSL